MPDPSRACENAWTDALRRSEHILGEDDFGFVQQFENANELLDEVNKLEKRYTHSAIPRLLQGLRPHLGHLQIFAALLVVSTGSENIQLACAWGIMCLLLQLACRSDQVLEEISKYLSDLGDKLTLFEVYHKAIDLEPEVLESFFDILLDLVLDCAMAIKHLRKNDISLAITLGSWNTVHQKFSKTLQDLGAKVDYLRQLVEAHNLTGLSQRQTELIQALSKYTVQDKLLTQAARLPYYQLPFGRNHTFFGRADYIQKLQEVLQPSQQKRSVRSVAVWGTGGIGKTQVALEFAHSELEAGCQLVLWIPSETESEISKALVEAASHIRPPGYEEGSPPEKTRFVMWNWLQTTDVSWLIVFDNVENNDIILQNWPVSGNGRLVVTCRSELLAASPAANQLEVLPFSTEESGELLLRLAHKDNSDPDEVQAAEQIAEMLGGLALALDITARQILVKKKTVRQFLVYFKENRPSLRMPPRYAPKNPYYSKNLVNVWQSAFDGLDEQSSRLLSLICFFAPDGIPRQLLCQNNIVEGAWPFLSKQDEYEDAEAELLYTSLIRINEKTDTISIHRLIQEAWYYAMPASRRHDSFCVAYRLLCKAFPTRIHGRQLYQGWETCDQLIHHVVTAQDKYEDLRQEGLDVQDPMFITLLADAAWFCSETCALQLGDRIGTRAEDGCSDKQSLVYAYLCESVATVYHRRGCYEKAHTYFQRSLAIREADPETPPRVLADSHSAVGLALFGLFRSEEAIAAVERAMAFVEKAPKDQQKTYNVDRYLRNRSRPKAALGRFEDAKQDVAEAEQFQTWVYGEDSHFHGETAYILGKIASTQGDQDLAAKYLQRAYDLQSPGKPTHQSVASARYHQALVCLRRNRKGDQEQALLHLEHALKITQFNEPRRGDQGESARVKWRLSQVMRDKGFHSEAALYRTQAEQEKARLESTGLFPTAPDSDQEWDCFSDLVDR